jgi:D-inositol-3-phosphate glycosyltransferase
MTRIAMLSVHTCPLAALGGKETGGMNVYVRELSRELGRMGFHVDVFTRSQNAQVPRIVPMGEQVRVIHLVAGPERPLPHEHTYRYLEEFVDSLEAFRLEEGITYDLIHGHYWLSGVVGLELRRRWSVPLLQMFHTLGALKNEVARSIEEREPPLRLEEEARLVRDADRLIAATPVDRAHLVWYYEAAPHRIVVIPCGVDTMLFRPIPPARAKAELGLSDDRVVLYVGRLAPIKGLETLLDSIPRLQQTRSPAVLIVGGGLDEPANGHLATLHSKMKALGIENRVRFLGAQPQERLPYFYAAAQVTVMPSYYESFGMVALEAMACGSPVIASRVGGLTVTVEDGINGFLVPEGDSQELARRVDQLFFDETLRHRLGNEAIRLASNYRWPCIADSIRKLYAEFLPAISPASFALSSCR